MGTAASYSRSVQGPLRCADRSPRVYYSSMKLIFSLLALVIAVCAPRALALAQIEITWSPSMVKGPSNAPVTIIEFSDYQ